MKEEWVYKEFEKCIEKVKYTKKIQTSDYKSEGLYPIVSQEEDLVSGYWDNLSDVFIVGKPIVVFGDHTRVLKYVDFDFVLGADGVKILQPIDELVAKFLLYYLKWCSIPSLGYSRHYKLLKELQIPVPPIETQNHIVSELDLLQSIIYKQQAQLKELDNLAQAVFYDMFGDPKRKGFTMKPLGSIAEMKSGYTPSEEELFRFGSYPYFKVGDMNTEGNQKYLSITKSYANPPKKVFPKDSIVFPKNGAAIGTNKKRILAQESIVDLNTAILICDKNQVVINYIYCWLLSIDFKDYTRRGAVPTLDSKELMNTLLPLPPLSLQQSFSAKIESIEKQKAAISKSIEETQKIFDYTMDKYFG